MIAGDGLVVSDLIEKRSQLFDSGRVRLLDHRIEDDVDGLIGCLLGTRRDWFSTVGAELVMRRERVRAIPAVFSDHVRARIIVDDAGLSKDVLVVLFGRDVFVSLPHVGIEDPMNAVLDLGAGIPLANHPGDGPVSEGVWIGPLLDAGSVGDPADLLAHCVWVDRSIVGESFLSISTVGFEFMEEGDVWIVRPRMSGTEIGSECCLRVNQRILRDLRAFEASSGFVWCVGGGLGEVDISYAKRQSERQAGPRVSKEINEGDISLMPCRLRQVVYVGFCEDFVGTRSLLLNRTPVDSRRPLFAGHFIQEEQDRVLVGPDSRIGEIVFVPQAEDEVMPVLFLILYEWGLGAFTSESSPSEVDFETGCFDTTVNLSEPLLNVSTVIIEDGCRISESTSLISEPSVEILGIIDAHTGLSDASYYKVTTRESTSSISYDIAENRPLASFSGQSSGGVAA